MDAEEDDKSVIDYIDELELAVEKSSNHYYKIMNVWSNRSNRNCEKY